MVPPSRYRARLALRVRAWILLLVLLAVVATVAAVVAFSLPPDMAPLAVAVGVGVAVTVLRPVWDTGRPRNMISTVTEFFVAVGLLTLPPAVTLLAVLAGNVVASILKPRFSADKGKPVRSWWTLAFSSANDVLGVVVAIGVTELLGPSVGRFAAALLGLVAMQAVCLSLVAIVVALDVGIPVVQVLREDRGGTSLLGIAVGFVGLLLGQSVASWSWGWLAVLAASGLVVSLSHLGMRVARELRHGRIVIQASLAAGNAVGSGDVVDELVEQVRQSLFASRVEVVEERPDWADVCAPLGRHGWIGVADRTLPSHAAFDHLDQDLLNGLAAVTGWALDSGALVAELEQADRVRATLLAAAAHDLRSPLAATGGSLETVIRHGDRLDPDTVTSLLQAASRGVAKATRLVHDLIVMERQHLSPRERAGRVADVAEAAHSVRDELVNEEVGRCRLDLEDDLPPVAIDPVLLQRVLDNLVGNALKHTGQDGTVCLRARRDEDEVLVVVDDHGPGVPLEQREAILEPFARGQTSTAGYGLGLHIATEFVRGAGGTIGVRDRADGQSGASFEVRLPVARRGPDEPDPDAGTTTPELSGRHGG